MVGGTALAAQPEQGFSARPPLPLTAARRSLRLLGAAALALLLAVAAAYAWQTRRMQIEASSATAQRRVDRLAEALTQALALGELAISQVETLVAALPQGRSLAEALAHAGQDRQQLLRALPLPFDVQACDARGCPMGGPGGGQGLPAAATLPTDAPGWTVQLPRRQAGGCRAASGAAAPGGGQCPWHHRLRHRVAALGPGGAAGVRPPTAGRWCGAVSGRAGRQRHHPAGARPLC